jgi:SAM-dependent methyltransferase
MTRTLKVDEEGLLWRGDERIADASEAKRLFSSIILNEDGVPTARDERGVILIEPFDALILARHVQEASQQRIRLAGPYGLFFDIDPRTLCLDAWDRLRGLTSDGLDVVFLRSAQEEFFELLEDYSDTSITIQGVRFETPAWPGGNTEARNPEWWAAFFRDGSLPWDLGAPHPALADIVPRLKLNKMRVLVLGSGRGHEAALMAQAGHMVTAIDFCPSALEQARDLYGHLPVQWVETDALNPEKSLWGRFDLVVEHTLFCAIHPEDRDQLVRSWRRLLAPRGQLLGCFLVGGGFRTRPPFPSSEWELRQRLRSGFRFQLWQRATTSAPGRRGLEALILAEKLGE